LAFIAIFVQNSGSNRIAFLAYVDKSTNPKTEHFSELLINYFDPDKVISDIKNIKDQVHKVICSIHWGVDYSFYPTPYQRKIAHELINSGADIIMGHHPHTLQPYERYKGGSIFYSLGGLTFGDYIKEGKSNLQALFKKTKRSAIVTYDLQREKIGFIPTKELKGNSIKIDQRDYEKSSERRWLLYKIKKSSRFMVWLFDFHEKVLYRVYEYFFGYYQNPVSRLLQFSNILKIRKLFKEVTSR